MKRLQIFSVALSISCGVGVLIAIILTSNQNTLPRTAVVIPTQNPVITGQKSLTQILKSIPKQPLAQELPVKIDPIVTSSVPGNTKNRRKLDINNIIADNKDMQNPYRGEHTVTVKTGDTLFAISRRTGIDVYQLAKLNSINAPFIIRPGQILRLDAVQ
ncbi:MAG: LysM peptidoglycan-binding domain-containing protein [Hyphomicrobiales bacterium]|nr:LysM peptidoglycan-binding domain-containing protein [Hyphomicrobiales bacterium]